MCGVCFIVAAVNSAEPCCGLLPIDLAFMSPDVGAAGHTKTPEQTHLSTCPGGKDEKNQLAILQAITASSAQRRGVQRVMLLKDGFEECASNMA
jgi:hypothetical protein